MTAGRAVVTSGLTVVVGFGALFFTPGIETRSVGIGGRWMASGRGTMNARYNNNSMTNTSDDAIRFATEAVISGSPPKPSTAIPVPPWIWVM